MADLRELSDFQLEFRLMEASYFADCPRDDAGRCKPKGGGGGSESPSPTEQAKATGYAGANAPGGPPTTMAKREPKKVAVVHQAPKWVSNLPKDEKQQVGKILALARRGARFKKQGMKPPFSDRLAFAKARMALAKSWRARGFKPPPRRT